MKSNETGTKRKVVRYTGGIAILLLLISFIYQWKNGLEVDTTENFSLALVVAIFLSSFIPERKEIVSQLNRQLGSISQLPIYANINSN